MRGWESDERKNKVAAYQCQNLYAAKPFDLHVIHTLNYWVEVYNLHRDQTCLQCELKVNLCRNIRSRNPLAFNYF